MKVNGSVIWWEVGIVLLEVGAFVFEKRFELNQRWATLGLNSSINSFTKLFLVLQFSERILIFFL